MGPRERLNKYLKRVKGQPFAWGSHDCLTFTNGAYRAMYGSGWADEWLDRYMVGRRPMRRTELKREYKFGDFTLAVDSKLQRCGGIPPLGALVTTKHAQRWVTGVAMGICTGTRAVFLSKEDVLYLPLDAIENSWIRSK